ncbi:MAG TPA: 4Fe-4S binding protein [Thermoclostridium sp.]|nr:4Fe-4S binding protein [Clostridiaceae bacterium]HOQ76049.1 4Fe-4S binding protein [Thermoclostridium sp.]HPU45024.1 4Fe-4S binding protein [Thermoclostridium sp.]
MKTIKISIYYPVDKITVPLVSTLIKEFDLQVNILHADISLNKTGTLVADVIGENKNVDDALRFIEEQGIGYKLFNKQLIWHEELCVHCGACTAVCPSHALTMSRETWNLEFDKEKCLVCGLCTKACPLNVMSLQD